MWYEVFHFVVVMLIYCHVLKSNLVYLFHFHGSYQWSAGFEEIVKTHFSLKKHAIRAQVQQWVMARYDTHIIIPSMHPFNSIDIFSSDLFSLTNTHFWLIYSFLSIYPRSSPTRTAAFKKLSTELDGLLKKMWLSINAWLRWWSYACYVGGDRLGSCYFERSVSSSVRHERHIDRQNNLPPLVNNSCDQSNQS